MSAESDTTEITVTVFHPSKVDTLTKTWSWTTKVGDAATEAAREFGVPNPESAGFLNEDDEELQDEKPLRAAGVEDADELELIDTTGGVGGPSAAG